MAYTLNRRLAQLVDSNGQLNTGKIPNDYITSDHVADNTITSAMLHTSFTVSTSNLTAIDTDDVSEGSTNLYYTTARWDTKMAAADTDDLSEGSTNLYFTNARIDSHLSGGTGVTYSSGAISIGQDVSTTATPTFGNITTTGYIAGPATFTIDPAAVGDNTGTVVIAGNLQVDGTTTTVNSTTVQVSDKTIELGYDATTDAANNGAGIVVSRPETSDASFLWSETNTRFEANKELSLMEQLTINANGTNDNHIEIGGGTSDNHYAYVDLIGDSTYTDYGLRIIRNNSGANTSSVIHHRGTGAFVLETLEAGIIKLRTSNTDALTVDTSQNTTFAGDVLIGSGGGLRLLPTDASDTDPWILYQYTDDTLRYNFTGSGADEIIIKHPNTTNATTLVVDTEQQRVGIGTSSPSGSLHIQPANSDTLTNAIFTRQNNAAGTDGNTFSLRNDATNNFVEMNSGGTNNGGYKFYRGNFSGDPALTIVGAGATGGYVGVGTETPQTLFETATTGTTTNRLTVSSANEFTQIWVEDNDLQGILWKDGSDFTFGPAADVGGSGWGPYITIKDGGNVGIGVANPGYKLAVSSKLVVGDNPAVGLSGNTIHVRENSSSGIHFPLVIGGGTHVAGAAFGLAFDPEGYGNRNKIAILAEGIGAGYSRGRLHFALEGTNTNDQVDLSDSKMCILENGNVGIGAQLDNAGHKLHIWGGSADTVLAVTTNDNYKSEVRMMEDKAGTTHGGFIRYDGTGDYVQIGHYNSGTEMMGWSMDDAGNIAVGATNASGHFEVHGGRMGIVSTDSSWEQLRICNTQTTGEAGIAIFNGANSGEFLSDSQPIFSNAFTLAINPYGCGSDTLAIGHGNLGDSIWHIDGSGNFGYGPNTENPLTYFEISKTRPNVNAPSDYELKLTLNTYGYCGSNYKLGMLQFVGGDTASAQDNFYAAVSARTVNGANNQEDGALQFHVKTAGYSDTLAAEFIGDNNPSSQIAGSGTVRNGMLFRWQGIAIDRSWNHYPGIAVMNSSDYSTNSATQAEFRVHGTNGSSSSYPNLSGSDFSVNFRVDGSFISGSDRRRKTNITTIDNALEKVNQLTGKRFQTVNRAGEVNEHQSKADNYKFGLIAQEVEDIIPEATKYYADEDDGTEGWNSSYSIDYPSLTALLVNAIKEQDVVIQDLKTRIETLEG